MNLSNNGQIKTINITGTTRTLINNALKEPLNHGEILINTNIGHEWIAFRNNNRNQTTSIKILDVSKINNTYTAVNQLTNIPNFQVSFAKDTPDKFISLSTTYNQTTTATTTSLLPYYNNAKSYVSAFYTDSLMSRSFCANPYLLRVDRIPINTSITTFSWLFNKCTNLEYVNTSDWNTAAVTDTWGLFSECTSLKSLDLNNLNVLNLKSCGALTMDCTNLTELKIDKWYTPQLEEVTNTFTNCSSLTKLDLSNWRPKNIIKFNSVFSGCTNIQEINLAGWNTTNATLYQLAFWGCRELTTLNISGCDFSNALPFMNGDTLHPAFYYLFHGCVKLANIIGPVTNIKSNINLGACPLTRDSAMVIINGLAEVDETRTVTFKATVQSVLSSEDLAIATNKGWTINWI